MKAPPECSEAQYDTSRANQDPGGPWPEAQQMQQNSRTNFTLTSYVTQTKHFLSLSFPTCKTKSSHTSKGPPVAPCSANMSSERPLRLLSPLLPAVCSFLPSKQLTPPAQPSPAPSGPLSSCSHGLEPRIGVHYTPLTPGLLRRFPMSSLPPAVYATSGRMGFAFPTCLGIV